MADWSDHEWKLLIGGELVAGANGTTPIVNPATEETVGLAPVGTVGTPYGFASRVGSLDASQLSFCVWFGVGPSDSGAAPVGAGCNGGVVEASCRVSAS